MSKSVSINGVNLIKRFEGCRLTAYKDSVGVWTIGYGTTSADKAITGTNIYSGLTISQSTADDWLLKSLNNKYLPNVLKFDSKYNWNQNQIDALTSFAYNIGSIDQLVAKGSRSISEISSSILLYNKAGGRVLQGLVNRRQAEKELFDKKTNTTTTTSNTTSSTTSKSVNYAVKIKVDSLNVRSGPGTGYDIKTVVKKNEVYNITEENNNWGKLKSVAGWINISNSYVEKITSSTTTSKNNTVPFQVKIKADSLNVRSGPGTDYKVKTVVKKNNIFTIVEVNNNWGKLKSGAGWISLNSSYTAKI